jgi:hypothetical protein
MKTSQTIGIIFISFSLWVFLLCILNILTNFFTATFINYGNIAILDGVFFFVGVLFLI